MNTPGKLALGIAVLIILAGVWYAVTRGTPFSVTSTLIEYSNADLGISFSYPDSYVVEERDLSTAQRKHASIILTGKADLPAPQNGEGPPTINVDAYQNDLEHYTLDTFIRATSFTNFKLSQDGFVASTTIRGASAGAFAWSGLYEGRTVIVIRDTWVYTFSVTYLTANDQIVSDFERILATVTLPEK